MGYTLDYPGTGLYNITSYGPNASYERRCEMWHEEVYARYRIAEWRQDAEKNRRRALYPPQRSARRAIGKRLIRAGSALTGEGNRR